MGLGLGNCGSADSPAKRAAARRPAAVRRQLAAVQQLEHRLALAPGGRHSGLVLPRSALADPSRQEGC